MFKFDRFIFVAAAVASTACGRLARVPSPNDVSQVKEAWNAANDPANLRDHYEVRLGALPLASELAAKPWTDTYWPSYEGGLANRWNDPTHPNAFTYATKTAAAVAAMPEAAMARLSPAEKYDIFVGRFDYPLLSEERSRTSADDPSWFGLCHGWAPAALNFKEPRPITLAGADGIRVPFGASDIKALLLFAQQDGRDERTAGERCERDDEGNRTDPSCRDVNAGSFHVIIANQIALQKKGFVADVSAGAEVWNQPVFGYKSELRGESVNVYPGAASGTVKIMTFRTRLRYISENGPHWDAFPFSAHPEQEGNRAYDYTIELNADGEIIGGEWISADHPDFLWTQSAPDLTDGYFRELADIYAASTQY